MTDRNAAAYMKRPKIFIPTLIASDTCKTIMQITAIQITVNHLLDIWPKKSIPPLKPIFIDLFKDFKIIFKTAVILRTTRVARMVS